MDKFEQKMKAAEQDAMKSMFLKLMDVCYERCVKGNYISGNMSKRELICTDECAAKVLIYSQSLPTDSKFLLETSV